MRFAHLFVLCLLAAPALADPPAIVSKALTYQHGDVVCEGVLVTPGTVSAPAPAVLVVHDWKGPSDHYRKTIAGKLAAAGYIAFAVDAYGTKVRPKTREECAAASGALKGNRPLFRARMQAAIDALKKDPRVDPKRIGAIGYCFGGTAVLEIARSGADVAGVVSLHGGLSTPTPADAKNIKAKVLVLHGEADRVVPDAEVNAFIAEMRGGKVDWQLIHYAGAVHGFTKPGARHHPLAAKRAWRHTLDFLAEALGK